VPDSGPELLADYGTRNECWPSNIYRVAAYNMGNISMMRRMADIYEMKGMSPEATALRLDAERFARTVIDELYVPGKGCWSAVYPDGTRIEARNVMDFAALVNMLEDVTPAMREETIEFMEREMITKHWMRGLSPRDPDGARAANLSVLVNRADFNPWGCYDGYVAYTIDAMFLLGYPEKAMDFLRRTEIVTHEGPYSQGHQFYGPHRDERDAPIQISAAKYYGAYNIIAGGGFADRIIRTLFGYGPRLEGGDILYEPELPRGFIGELRHLRHRNKLYTITSDDAGLTSDEE
jgi:hypothetical protein